MKIAIIGTDQDAVQKLTMKALGEWTIYKTPSETIFNISYPEKEEDLSDEFKEWTKNYNEDEKKILFKLDLLLNQDKKYKEVSYLFYTGSGISLVCEAVVKNAQGIISDEVVDKVIYYNKKLMRNLDAIFWLPNPIPEDNQDEDLENLELAHANLWEEYQHTLGISDVFEKDNVPGFLRIDDEPISYMRYVINPSGNLASNSDDIVDMSQMERLLQGAPEMLNFLKEKMNAKLH